MIIDITGKILLPGKKGRDCPRNVENNQMVCCCDECDYMMCCLPEHDGAECLRCKDKDCPRSGTEYALLM